MATDPLRRDTPRVTLASAFPTNTPRDALLLLLDGVLNLNQWIEWADDYRLAGFLLSRDDQVELAAFGGMRKGDILHERKPREFV